MAQFTKTSSRRKLLKKPPSSEAADTERKGRKQGLIIASLIIMVIAAVVGIGYYLIYAAPFQQTIIVVDDTSINMRYFLKRTQMASEDPMTMLGNLTNELIIKKVAPQPPYNIEVTAEDIDETLREIARGESETISDSEFREWHRQQLNETGLSDSEYKDLMRTLLLRAGLHMYLAERMPTVAEQVHLHAIFVESYEDAEAIRARWEAGEDFADLAREVSTDEASVENGGEIGWFPYGVLDDTFSYVALNLAVGEVSQPVPIEQAQTEEVSPEEVSPEEVTYALIMVSEKADAREVDENYLPILQSKALDEWLINESQFHKVEFHGRNNGFDSETAAWIGWQLQRMAK